MHFKMSSAICFNLDQSKILEFGNGLTLYQIMKCMESSKFRVFADNSSTSGGLNYLISCK